ncbi:MAG TPA: N-acetylmuramoyl-L-alanine amidase [Sphingomicrobium sp.]|nr:N-acetylmuramoyl-L-alanine amidase [Sphingomicrobium sp.]
MLARGIVAGAAALGALIGGFLLMMGPSLSGAAGSRDEPVPMGESRPASLTVDVPPPITDHIYAAPGTAGRPIVVIDAGHGGRDPGATSVSGEVTEKQLTLTLARELRDALVKRGRVRVAMTREDDRYVDLEARAAVARRVGASLFVSLHTDSAPNPLARGATVYSLSDIASDAEAARFAEAENRGFGADSATGSPVAAMLADLAARSEMAASADFAARVIGKSTGRFGLRPTPHRFAAFHVLRRAEAAAVLFEAGYISNVDDELLLRSPEHRHAIVAALAQAIEADVAARLRH